MLSADNVSKPNDLGANAPILRASMHRGLLGLTGGRVAAPEHRSGQAESSGPVHFVRGDPAGDLGPGHPDSVLPKMVFQSA